MTGSLAEVLDGAHGAELAAESWISLCGTTAAIGFTHPALAAALTPALSHLIVEPSGQPDLRVVVGSGPTPFDRPEPAPPPDSAGPGVVHRFLLHADDTVAYLAPDDPLWVLDRAGGRGVCWFPGSPEALPSWERGAPLKVLVHWWAAAHGQHMVHAAAIGDRSGAVLVVGRGGSGKSTTALAAALAGQGYLGDDYCLLAPPGPGPATVHCLYATGKCDARSLSLVPGLAERIVCPAVAGDDGDKAVLLLADLVVHQAPVRAVVVPRVAPGATGMSPLSPSAALRALAPSTMFQLPGHRAESFAAMSALVRSVPSYSLSIGSTPTAAAAELDALRRHLAGHA